MSDRDTPALCGNPWIKSSWNDSKYDMFKESSFALFMNIYLRKVYEWKCKIIIFDHHFSFLIYVDFDELAIEAALSSLNIKCCIFDNKLGGFNFFIWYLF